MGKSLERGIEKKRWLLDFLIPLPICGQVSDRDGQNGRMVRTCCASCYLEGKRFSSGGARGWKLLPLLFEVAWKWLISRLACGWGKLLFTTFPRAGRKGGGSSGSEWPHLHALSWKVMRIRRGKLKITSQKQANKPTCKHPPPIVEREWEYKGENSKQTSICSSINVTIITTILIVLHMPSGLHFTKHRVHYLAVFLQQIIQSGDNQNSSYHLPKPHDYQECLSCVILFNPHDLSVVLFLFPFYKVGTRLGEVK